jgi:hypothetical protein
MDEMMVLDSEEEEAGRDKRERDMQREERECER